MTPYYPKAFIKLGHFGRAEMGTEMTKHCGRTIKILIIDDDPQVCKILRRMLEPSGYQVLEAPDGRKGLRLYTQYKPEVVITDIIMPEKEGLETIIELRHEHPEARIIAISAGGTGQQQGSYLLMAKQLGAHAILSKPVSKRNLLDSISALVPPEPGEPCQTCDCEDA